MRTSSPSQGGRRTATIELGASVAVGVGSVFLVMELYIRPGVGFLLFLAVLAAFALAHRSGRYHDPRFLAVWVGIAAVLAVVSAATGFFNGLTDEPYAVPAYVRLLPDLYGRSLVLSYYQYGSGPLTLSSAYIYLPLMTFLQVPGLDYRWVTVGAWALMVYLVRRTPASVFLLGGPWVALLAANGFNDFVPLFFLTLFFAVLSGWSARAAEVVALGLKQFANVIVVVYYLWKRRWREALLAVGITAAFLLPFALLDPDGVLCHAVLLDPQAACTAGNSLGFASEVFTHLNYPVWVLWLLAILGPAYVVRLKGPEYASERAALARTLGTSSAAEAGSSEVSAWHLVLLPFVRVRELFRRRVRSVD